MIRVGKLSTPRLKTQADPDPKTAGTMSYDPDRFPLTTHCGMSCARHLRPFQRTVSLWRPITVNSQALLAELAPRATVDTASLARDDGSGTSRQVVPAECSTEKVTGCAPEHGSQAVQVDQASCAPVATKFSDQTPLAGPKVLTTRQPGIAEPLAGIAAASTSPAALVSATRRRTSGAACKSSSISL